MRTVKRRAPRIMQRITGREKMPGSGAEPKMIPEERRGPSGFMRSSISWYKPSPTTSSKADKAEKVA